MFKKISQIITDGIPVYISFLVSSIICKYVLYLPDYWVGFIPMVVVFIFADYKYYSKEYD